MSPASNIHIRYEESGLESPRKDLTSLARKTLKHCLKDRNIPNAEVTVLFCSRDEIHRLNDEFLDEDKPTDVLSFPFYEQLPELAPEETFYLGDMAICLPVCNEQKPTNRDLCVELRLMLIHGFLHLVGYDHDTAENKKEMWKEQNRLLKETSDLTVKDMIVIANG